MFKNVVRSTPTRSRYVHNMIWEQPQPITDNIFPPTNARKEPRNKPQTYINKNWNILGTYNKSCSAYGIIETASPLGQSKLGVEKGPSVIMKHNPFIKSNFGNSNNVNKYHAKCSVNIDGIEWSQSILPGYDLKCDYVNKNLLQSPRGSLFNDSKHTFPKNLRQLDNLNHVLYYANTYSQELCDMTINLMGDHSSSIASLLSTSSYDPDAIVVWIDAHPDINTHKTSPTGNVHGMSVAIAGGFMNTELYQNDMFKWMANIPKFNLKNLIYIGIRDIDEAEANIIKKYGITVLDKNNTDELITRIFDKNVHISLDVDSLDPSYFSCTGTPVSEGLSSMDVQNIITEIHTYGNLIKLDIAEFNPLIEPQYVNKCLNIITNNVIAPAFGLD
jgi:arginase